MSLLVLYSATAAQSVAVGTATETDAGVPLIYPQTRAVGTASETDAGGSIAATGTNAAQAGLIWFWQVAAPATSVTVGTAHEADTAPSITVYTSLQAVVVGTAYEVDRAGGVSSTPAGTANEEYRMFFNLTPFL